MNVEPDNGTFCVDASLVAELLGVAPARVHALIRSHEITSVCEQGVAEHAGQFRLTFFYKSRRARLNVDAQGKILRRSVVDFGEAANARAPRRTAGR
jgi:hypothetical protein